MALESVFAKAPPKVGHANKDTQNGEIESSVDDGLEVDLEEGEIVDSGKEDSEDDAKADAKFSGGDCGTKAPVLLRMDKKKKKNKRKKEGDPKGPEDEEWFSPASSPRHRSSSHHHGHHDYPVGPFEEPFMRSPCGSPDRDPHLGGGRGRRKPPPHGMDKRAALLLKKKKKKLKPMGGGGRPPNKRGEGHVHKGGRSICKFYLDSKCLKGADCPFSHDAPVPRKQDLCKFYLSGYCARGENCSFMHEDFPCKFFHTGAKCFADTHCRFSHAPLDEEKQLLLQRYLDSHGSRMDDYGGDEGLDHGRHRASSPLRGGGPFHQDEEGDEIAPPPAKRPSLLGSPPRHVKEAAESWRMQFLGGSMGGLGPSMGQPHIMSPPRGPPFIRPNNFYVDSLSPVRGGPLMSPPQLLPPAIPSHLQVDDFAPPPGPQGFRSPSINIMSPHDQDIQDPREEGLGDKPGPSKSIPTSSEYPLHSPSSPPAASQESSSIPPGLTLLLASVGKALSKASPDAASGDTQCTSPREQGKDDDNASQLQPPADAIPVETTATDTAVLPPNLPRRQRELFLRIQQQQKEQREAEESAQKEATKSAEEAGQSDESEEEKEDGEGHHRVESSSDDDEDFDDDRPLTAVLKKLQQQSLLPREKKEEAQNTASPPRTTDSPSVTTAAQSSPSLPTIDIAKMLSSIRQQVPSSQPQADFWKQLFSSTVPQAQPLSCSSGRDPRRAAVTKVDPPQVALVPTPVSRDPRLRHDRPHHTPKPEIAYIESKDGDAPYKLRTIFRACPDYSAIVQLSVVDIAMRNDPRLAKHLAAKEEKASVAAAATAQMEVAVPTLPQPQPEPVGKPVKTASRDPRVARHLEQQSKTADPRRAAVESPPQVTLPPLGNPVNSSPGNGLLPTPTGLLPTPLVAPTAPVATTRMDPRLARRLEQQKARQSEKTVNSSTENASQKDKSKKKPQKEDKRKGRMDYSSPLSSYDEGDKTSGYSAYQRRPRPAPIVTSTPTSIVSSTPSDVQTTLMPPPPVLPATLPTALPINPLPMSITADELLFDDKQETKSLKEVFKTKDPTASPFC